MKKLTDKSKMPYGMYEGISMGNVPASYLLFLKDNEKCNLEVKNYILNNIELLEKETKRG